MLTDDTGTDPGGIGKQIAHLSFRGKIKFQRHLQKACSAVLLFGYCHMNCQYFIALKMLSAFYVCCINTSAL